MMGSKTTLTEKDFPNSLCVYPMLSCYSGYRAGTRAGVETQLPVWVWADDGTSWKDGPRSEPVHSLHV